MNKTGWQAQVIGDAQRVMLRATFPWCLKLLHTARDLAFAREWRTLRQANGGGGVLVLRYVTSDTEPLAELPALTDRALREFDGFQTLAGDGITVVLEVPVNERFHTDPADFAALAQASLAAAGTIKAAGFTPGVLVTSEGNPPGPNFGLAFFEQPRVLEALLSFRAMGAVWCPHGYSHPPAAADDEYHSTRPARIMAALPEMARLNYLYGEDGCDGGTDQPNRKPGRGWRDYFATPRDYADWYRAKARALAADPLCVGSAIFLSGSYEQWASFSIEDEVDLRGVFREAIDGPPIRWVAEKAAPVDAERPSNPQETGGTVADVVLGVPARVTHAADGNWGNGEAFGPCRGVVVHSTGGAGRTLEAEYVGTVNWFTSPEAGVSAHRVVGAGKMAEVCTSVHDHEKAYHAREPSNTNRRGIEIAHPDGFDDVVYTDFQYEAVAELIVRWKLADEARGWVWPLKLLNQAEAKADAPGIVYHRDLPAGIKDGRRDPTPPFDGTKLMVAVNRWYAKLKGGSPVPPNPTQPTQPTTVDIAKERDALWTIAERLERGGWSWLGQGIKALVATSKGDR